MSSDMNAKSVTRTLLQRQKQSRVKNPMKKKNTLTRVSASIDQEDPEGKLATLCWATVRQ